MIGLLLALAMMADPQLGVADPAAAHPVTEGVKSEWIARPSGSQMVDLYPKGARRAGARGYVVLSCIVGKDHRVSDCRVIEETPVGMGFGEATLRLSQSFRMKQFDADGKPTSGASIRVPIAWNPPM